MKHCPFCKTVLIEVFYAAYYCSNIECKTNYKFLVHSEEFYLNNIYWIRKYHSTNQVDIMHLQSKIRCTKVPVEINYNIEHMLNQIDNWFLLQ